MNIKYLFFLPKKPHKTGNRIAQGNTLWNGMPHDNLSTERAQFGIAHFSTPRDAWGINLLRFQRVSSR
jgi:hypothetical protein